MVCHHLIFRDCLGCFLFVISLKSQSGSFLSVENHLRL